jgi:RNA processing factor Prp31
LSDILTEEIERDVKDAAEISMGTEINEIDEKYIKNLATQVVELGKKDKVSRVQRKFVRVSQKQNERHCPQSHCHARRARRS